LCDPEDLLAVPATEPREILARLVRRAEAARTPLLFLRHGILPAAGAEAAVTTAVSGAAVPAVTVRVGGWHGPASVGTPARFRVAWPTAHAALSAGSDPASALYLSGQLDDDGIIDPRDTRTVLGFCLSVSQPGTRP
jgi:acetyl-CoA carboxylase carboxyltransferase component